MGLSALRDLAAIEAVPYEAVDGSDVAVDALNWLYRYLTITVRYVDEADYTTPAGDEVPNLVGIVRGLPRLLEHRIVPVFVFDGAVIDLKRAEMRERDERREAAAELAADARDRGDGAEAAKYAARAQGITDVILETTRRLLELLDVPIVDAPLEAEAQAAFMAREGSVDAVGSEDYDTLLFGAPVTLRKLTSTGDVERMDLAATLDRHGITQRQLVDVAILCGTDYNEGVHGYGPKRSLAAIREYGSLDGVLEAEGIAVEHVDRIRAIYLDPEVTEDYAIDPVIEPALDRAHDYVCAEWGVPPGRVERAFERLSAATPVGR